MLLADCFAVALRELGCVRQRRRVCGVECAELALRRLAVGECGGVFPLLAAMGRVDDRNDGRREQPRDGEERHDDGERRVAAPVRRRVCVTGEFGIEKIEIVDWCVRKNCQSCRPPPCVSAVSLNRWDSLYARRVRGPREWAGMWALSAAQIDIRWQKRFVRWTEKPPARLHTMEGRKQ